MQQPAPRNSRTGLRILSACLLTWLLIMMPLVPLAPPSRAESPGDNRASKAKLQSADTASGTSAAPNSVSLTAPVPQPAPEPPVFAPAITATKDDGLAAATTVAPGGTINYTVTVNNNGA